ncbi:hypothetical protein EIP86_002064 [Pleurotus ostreatoroseus]|nr:hypothetical protein EIP86_002064 [Pleurotus ostreatoroseus]
MNDPAPAPGRTSAMRRLASRVRDGVRTVYNHTLRHTGVGIVCAVAYFDPGNWGVDLQAGSQYGYKLLFVVLLSGIFAVFLQILASRLGCVTGLDLASHCRLLLHDRPRHKLFYRWALLYPLYLLSEAAIVATDLAELLGSGIALCLLFPKLPLWAGVLITASDVLVFLALKDPLGGRPVRLFELIIAAMVFTVLICMAVIISQVGVRWGDAFLGFVPSRTVFQSGGLYTSIGIIGATVMPHSIFLGSALATQDRLAPPPKKLPRVATASTTSASSEWSFSDDATLDVRPWRVRAWRKLKLEARAAFRIVPLDAYAHDARTHAEHENHSEAFVRAHVYHGMVDIAVSLLGLAVVINALILILASAVFYYGPGAASSASGTADADPASLFDAYALLRDLVGQGAATLFALALLASGQSSSVIATVAGQTVSEGFLRWRVSPILRRLLTRALGLVPALAVAIAAGRGGVDALLVASQVALSIVLPFVVFPLLWLTGDRGVMSVRKGEDADADADTEEDENTKGKKGEIGEACVEDVEAGLPTLPSGGVEDRDCAHEQDRQSTSCPPSPHSPASRSISPAYPSPHLPPSVHTPSRTPAPSQHPSTSHLPSCPPSQNATPDPDPDPERAAPPSVSFASHWSARVLGWALWLVIVAANAYAIVSLGLGEG